MHNKIGSSDCKIEGKKYINASSGFENMKSVFPGIGGKLADIINAISKGCSNRAINPIHFSKILLSCI